MSDNEDDTIESQFYKPSYVLVAIDTHPSMFIKREEDSSSPFKDSLTACYELANSLIFTENKRSWSPFGIALAREGNEALVKFSDNVLESIKSLKEKSELDEKSLVDLYERRGGYDLAAFFLFCKKLFKAVSSIFYKRTIIYITSHDDPVAGDKNMRFAALNEAKNFQADDIEFQLVTTNQQFDYKKFYNELFAVMKSNPTENIAEDMEGLLEKLSSCILSRYYQRKLGFYPFPGDKKRFLKIIQKNFTQKPKLYAVAAKSSDGKTLKKVTRSEGGCKSYILDKHQTFKFTLEEYNQIKSTDYPIGYSLLYVSDRLTDVGFVLNSPLIIESNPKEELNYFDSFWQYCVDNRKVLVCLKKTKHTDKIRLVELIPKFANNSRNFLVKSLPFYEELQLPAKQESAETKYPPEKSGIAERLIERLSYDYDPKIFTNPSFAKMRAYLRAELLGQKEAEPVEDVTLDAAGIDSGLGNVADDFRILFDLDGEKQGEKRKAPTARGRAKKAK